jgi:hypothetical protein
MHEFDISKITTAGLDGETNVPVIQAAVPISEDPTDVESFGDLDSYQALGVTSLPFPETANKPDPDDNGFAEAVILRDVGNQDAVVIGARDTRTTEVYGDIAEGDTVLHSVDPDAVAQVQCKANKQIALVTEDSDGNTMLHLIDGKNDKIQIAAFGGIIEMTRDNGISIVAPGGDATITLKGDTIVLAGKVILGGAIPVLNFAGGLPASITSAPPVLTVLPNVYAGQ